MENGLLSGMKAISDFCGSLGLPHSPATINDYKNKYGMPVKKLGNGDKSPLIAHRDDIIRWSKAYKNEMTINDYTDEELLEEAKKRGLLDTATNNADRTNRKKRK